MQRLLIAHQEIRYTIVETQVSGQVDACIEEAEVYWAR